MKIIVLFPTATEAQFFSHPLAQVEFCGVGLSATAYHTTKIITQHRPDWLILAGIAGVYPQSSFAVGDVALVTREHEADLGFFTPQGFTHLADLTLDMDFHITKHWECPYLLPESLIPSATSNSMNAAMAPFVNTLNIDLENMEGAAFFQVCLAEQQRFLELRAVSNMVDINTTEEWDFTGSIQALTQKLHILVNYLLHSH
ncbi:hypothetical protein [Cellvibrio sp. pealriver]|uniref:phosphorylase family protein n=1 Tax=Cellvibrio sp. pealriver TaxID=1622269 RepID=UPI00066FB78D|nr:hypothetical protein [Cellvibrio sp. pealriver]